MSVVRHDPRRLESQSYPFSMSIAPRYADMDILRHLNNLALAEYHEEARTRFFMSLFGDDFLFRRREYRLLPVRTTYDYLREAHYLLPLQACAGVARIGRASFEVAMALFQDGQCVGLASATTVHVTANGSAPLTEELRAALQKGVLCRDSGLVG
jgi:acyl-CoA thioester hydrolase